MASPYSSAPPSSSPETSRVSHVAPRVSLVEAEARLAEMVTRLGEAPRIAVDLESNGLFKYRATLCTMQLAEASSDAQSGPEVFVVDTIAASAAITKMGELLGDKGPRKIVHDVAFDARILAESGIRLGHVHDTSIAARMLGRTATGLASLLGAELGIAVDKKLQHHDWTERPLRSTHLRYLADDVVHLGSLADKLWAEVTERGIADEVEEETRYRIGTSIAAASSVDPRPPWIRLKGIDRVPASEHAILRRLAELREDLARKLDVPPYKVLGPDILFAIARAKPRTMGDLGNIKGAMSGPRARSLAPALIAAVKAGLDDPSVPEDERAMLVRPRLPPAIAKARRLREQRLTSWRKKEAKSRGVDEQVVLPGHCLQDLADLHEDAPPIDDIARVPGIGSFRVTRYGAILEREVLPAPADAGGAQDPSDGERDGEPQ